VSDTVIHAENLSKRYRIGQRQRYLTLRDVLSSALRAPVRMFWAAKSRRANGDATHIWALKDVSFEVRQGEVVGIIGRNGAGKTTLLKILARVAKPTAGFAEVRGRMGSLLEVGTGFHPELTGRENTFLSGAILGMSKVEIQRKFDEIVAFAEVDKFIDTPLKYYSTGMQTRLAFAVAAHLEPEILLVDEVLSVGDIQFQRKCLGKMGDVARQGRTILLVSHNIQHMQAICRSGLLLEMGKVVLQGDISHVVSVYVSRCPSSGANHRIDKGRLAFDGISNRAELDNVLPDADLQFRLKFRSGEMALDDVMVDFALHNERNEYIVHSKSRLLDFRFSVPARREFEIIYQVKSPRLAPGKYTLTVYVHDGQNALLWVDNIDACLIRAKPCFGIPELFDGIHSVMLPEFSIHAEVS
jgi:lipopolysaccharide transport system ATP-binding protein